MKKIPTLFVRSYNDRDPRSHHRMVLNEVTPGCEWVLAGEGVATRKYDGTCCMVREGTLYKRYEVKMRAPVRPDDIQEGWTPERPLPSGFLFATSVDPVTRKAQGWVPVGDGAEDKWHREAFARDEKWNGQYHEEGATWADGTYELCGPRVQGNPEGFDEHVLVVHGYAHLFAFPRTYDEIKKALTDPSWTYEGVVFHHPDGRMAKIKKRDFSKKGDAR